MKSILLVDDDPACNFLIKKILERINFRQVHSAYNGSEAIELLTTYYQEIQPLPDIILLDINMPVMDGFTFIEAFRKLDLPDKARVRIVIVTSSEAASDINKAKAFGIDDYILKPVTAEKLKEVLE